MTEWLNYHHLRYFWMVAKEGGLARAAAKLHVSQPSISEQIRELEETLGEKLFIKQGRQKVLSETGHVVLGYADEIFSLGNEMVGTVKNSTKGKTLRVTVGIADSFPKLLTSAILKPIFDLSAPVHVVCREGKMNDLLAQLAAHRLDFVLADEPSSSSSRFKTFNHFLGETGTVFMAEKKLAQRLKRRFPQSLNGEDALLPADNTTLRRSLELWFQKNDLRPRVLAEFEDLALMKVMAADGKGFIALPSIACGDAKARYGFVAIGESAECRIQLHAITAERRIHHPAVEAVIRHSTAM